LEEALNLSSDRILNNNNNHSPSDHCYPLRIHLSDSPDSPIWLQVYFQVPPQISVVNTFRSLNELCPTQDVPILRCLLESNHCEPAAAVTAASKQRDASFFHASSIHCTKVITRPRDPRLKEHPVLFSENSLPSIRSHNKPNKNPQVNNGLCPALVQLNKVQAKASKLNLYILLQTEQL
jgi:hypothetical protein